MSLRTLAIPVAVLFLTMGCFEQLKSGNINSSDDTATVDDEGDEEDCDEDELEELREECAEGDNDACLELARYIEWCEDDRDDDDWDDEDEDECDEECGEETWREAYGDCIEAGGSEADCESRADRALEACLEECDDDDDDDDDECRDGETTSRGECEYVCADGEWTSDDPECL
jgi:hypothetical protein